ncbi:MAG: hypothetical protein ABW157_09970 [Candidatus Thiodiazotropha sp. LLP2]
MTENITTTQSGTMIIDGVEYSTYPPPEVLVKAMERRWADKLLKHGSIRFGSLATYRQWENAVLGDPNDGEGKFRMDGHSYDIGSINPVYAWCASMPTITTDRTLLIAKHGMYDCVVHVHEPLLMIQRVRAALAKSNKSLEFHCAEVSYNRGVEVDKQALNSQKFHFNVFQKDPGFSPDREYRLSLTDNSFRFVQKNFVDLVVGGCSDIMSIEALPNNTM